MPKKTNRMATVKPTNNVTSGARKIHGLALTIGLVLALGVGIVIFSESLHEYAGILLTNDKQTQITEGDLSFSADSEERNAWQLAYQNPIEFAQVEDIEGYVRSRVKQSFFSLDVDDLIAVLVEHPWVKSATARKVWPNQILVDIEEHQPWLNLNNKKLISIEGIVFEPNDVDRFEQLPLLSGEYGKIDDLLEMYRFFDAQMPSHQFNIVAMAFDQSTGWTLRLQNNVELYLGKQFLTDRLDRFFTVVDSLGSSQKTTEQMSYVDLRYNTGIAIGWQEIEQLAEHQKK